MARVAAGWGVLFGVLVSLLWAALMPLSSAVRWKTTGQVTMGPMAARSTVVANDGSVLAVLHDGEERAPVLLTSISPILQRAVLDAEDANFFEHHGIDGRGVVRALVADADRGRVVQGGSTISQQLVKIEALTPKRDMSRKVREMNLALRLEKQYRKAQILERYLNRVYFGAGASGVQVAAERYFGTDAQNLTVAQAALLAGVIRNPNRDNPFDHPDMARRRRDAVLAQMVERNDIDEATAAKARTEPLPTTPSFRYPPTRDGFTDQVVRQLADDAHLGSTRQARVERLFRGGLTIHTTIDPAMQAAAQRAVATGLPPSQFQAAVVAIDPATGAVRALVGRSGPQADGFNLATDGARQAGSSFKMIALAAAIEAGHSPLDLVDATAQCTFPMGNAAPWNVHNYEAGEGGDKTVWDATVHSLNCAYARIVTTIGPAKVVDMANRLGVRRHLDAVPSITLGTEEVSPIEMATVAATFAADGIRHDPVFVTRVEDETGSVLIDNSASSAGTRVIAPQVARSCIAVLRDVINRGTGVRANIGRPAAGKTGTTEEWSDAWFVGFTPILAAAVWMGSPAGRVPMRGVGGVNVTGGTFPAQMWNLFMSNALAPFPATDFPPPDTNAWGAPGRIGAAPKPAETPSTATTATTPATTTTRPPSTTSTTQKKKHGG